MVSDKAKHAATRKEEQREQAAYRVWKKKYESALKDFENAKHDCLFYLDGIKSDIKSANGRTLTRSGMYGAYANSKKLPIEISKCLLKLDRVHEIYKEMDHLPTVITASGAYKVAPMSKARNKPRNLSGRRRR